MGVCCATTIEDNDRVPQALGLGEDATGPGKSIFDHDGHGLLEAIWPSGSLTSGSSGRAVGRPVSQVTVDDGPETRDLDLSDCGISSQCNYGKRNGARNSPAAPRIITPSSSSAFVEVKPLVGGKGVRQKFFVDNRLLNADGPGIALRNSKNLSDRCAGQDDAEIFAPWGATLEGIDEGDGWVNVDGRYLPLCVGGLAVLTSMAQWSSDWNSKAFLNQLNNRARSCNVNMEFVAIDLMEPWT